MAGFALAGDTSGQLAVNAPAVAGSNTLTLQAATATNAVNVFGTAVTCAGQTSIDFTGLPSWIKRITVMFSLVSTSGTSLLQIQLGDSGGIENTGYTSYAQTDGGGSGSVTSGFVVVYAVAAASLQSGRIEINLVTGTTWVASGNVGNNGGNISCMYGNKTLSDVLDRVRITTVNGTDTFDATPSAGSINILYEG
jgi:hypothetical protein